MPSDLSAANAAVPTASTAGRVFTRPLMKDFRTIHVASVQNATGKMLKIESGQSTTGTGGGVSIVPVSGVAVLTRMTRSGLGYYDMAVLPDGSMMIRSSQFCGANCLANGPQDCNSL